MESDPTVVSLLPSATETLYALGVEPAAVSHECDYPPAARGKPAANRARIDATGSSSEINEAVAEAETEGGVYELREDVLESIDPDLIVSQGVCDVCAVSDTLVRETVERLDLDAEVIATHPHSVGDVLADVERLGEKTGRGERAADLIGELERRIDRVRERAPDDGPRVLVTDWMEPVMVAGHWVPEMVEWLGASYGMADRGDRSRPRHFEDVVEYDPEVLIVAPCGFDLDETRENLGDIAGHEDWTELTAVRDGEVYVLDGHEYVNRPGPRLVDTLEHFAGILHPEEFGRPPGDVAERISQTEAIPE